MKTLKQIFYILSKKQKWQFLVLLIGMIIGAFLELFGISILLPIIDLISADETTMPSVISSNFLLSILFQIFNLSASDTKTLFVTVIVFVMLVYVFKALYSIGLNALSSAFVNKFRQEISTKLFKTYLLQPYDFHLYRNTSDLLRSATYDASNFVSALTILLSILSDSIFCLALTIYLFVVDWKITLIVLVVIGGVSAVLLWSVKRKVYGYGRQSWVLNAESNKAILESLGGIKETIVSGREGYFIDHYDSIQKDTARVSFKNAFLSIIPRVVIEAVGMISILVALLIYVLTGATNAAILSTFSLFVVAIVKLLPYVSRFNGEINGFRFTMKSIHNVYDDLQLVNSSVNLRSLEAAKAQMPFSSSILMQDVSFTYKGGSKPVLDSVSCSIKKGESTAFCGMSGAGKTTTVDLLLGLLSPSSGSILCDKTPISSDLKAWHKNISYIPQEIFLVDDTIRNNVAFGIDPSLVNNDEVWKALDAAQLGDFVRSLPKQLDSQIGEKGVRLSGGQRQRIGIARALFRNTQIIVFDEATSALDYQTEGEILKTVNGLRGSKTLIIITHRLNTIQNCDRIYEIKDGKMTCIKGGESDAH
jgi:ABC-type multidrug transport system fused ATPase/permease subunit